MNIDLNYPWSANYYHWLVDILPAALEGGATEVRVNAEISRNRPYIRESLTLLGLPFEEIHEIQPIKHCREWSVSRAVELLREAFADVLDSCWDKNLDWALAPQGISRIPRIWVGRDNRKLEEEASITQALDAPFMDFGKMHLAVQIKRAHGAETLAGVTGAGLTNMIWMPEGGLVIEIASPNYPWSNVMGVLAHACGHHRLLHQGFFHSGEPGHPYKHTISLKGVEE